jgi:hypothetical protein
MKETRLTLPEVGLIAGSRVALGIGIGLLLSEKLSESQRRAVGFTLLAVGVLSTFPLMAEVLSKSN